MSRWWVLLAVLAGLWALRAPDYLNLYRVDPAWFSQDFNYYYQPSLAYREGWLDLYWVPRYEDWSRGHGLNPSYACAEYPPLTYLIHVPFTLMSRPDASVLYFHLSHLLAALTALVMAWGLPVSWRLRGRVVAAGAAFLTIILAAPSMDLLYQGQMGMIQLFLVTLFCALYLKGWRLTSTLPLALAVSFKLTPAAFLLYLLRKGDGKTLGASVAWLGVLTLPVLATTGSFKLFFDFFLNLPRILIVPASRMNQGLGFLTTILGPSDYGPAWIDALWLARPLMLALALLTLVLTLAWVRPRDFTPAQVALELAVVTVFQIYAPSRAWPHYEVYLALTAWLLVLYPSRRYLGAACWLWWAGAFSGTISAREWEIPFRYALSTWGVPTLVMLVIWALLVRALLSRQREGLSVESGNCSIHEPSLDAGPGSLPGGLSADLGASLSAGLPDTQ